MTDEEQGGAERLALEAVDELTYAVARPLLRDALEFTLAAGRTVQDWAEFCIEKFGGAVVPYLQRLVDEIRTQSIRIDGWASTARGTLFGTPLAPEDREQWIREAAYFRAERRDFVGGSPDEDWAEAERDVARWEASHAGLLSHGMGAVLTLGDVASRGFQDIRDTLGRWLARRPPSGIDSHD
jgi:hypothetical protein